MLLEPIMIHSFPFSIPYRLQRFRRSVRSDVIICHYLGNGTVLVIVVDSASSPQILHVVYIWHNIFQCKFSHLLLDLILQLFGIECLLIKVLTRSLLVLDLSCLCSHFVDSITQDCLQVHLVLLKIYHLQLQLEDLILILLIKLLEQVCDPVGHRVLIEKRYLVVVLNDSLLSLIL